MSMLSAQCDELRSMAESVGLAMPQAATLMMGAADTIDRLESENHMLRELVAEMMIAVHEYAEKAQSENAKLRDENQSIGMAAYELGRKSMAAENAKLRELVADMWREGMCECGSLGKCATCMYEYPTRMRELGVEVDG